MDSRGSGILNFMEFTNSDEDQARYYVESAHGNLEVALNMYFSEVDSQSRAEELFVQEVSALSQDDFPPSTPGDSQEAPSSEVRPLTILSWNVDGLSKSNLQSRSQAVCHLINSKKPDAVFLQEVVPETFHEFSSKCAGYDCFPCNVTQSYFNMILLNKSRLKYNVVDFILEGYQGSNMGRHMLYVPVAFNSTDIVFMVTHLESTKQCIVERKKQLQYAFDKIQQQAASKAVIFGGDLNVRDSEIEQLGGLPVGLIDAWEACGKDPSHQYTWDTSANDNLGCNYTAKLRFDRLFVKPTDKVYPWVFSLVGKERLRCGEFPSDHWGIICEFR